tara:strand:- start:9717 stop:9893 length:177 start_codon:yes stop_codon:yes gene_type:complete
MIKKPQNILKFSSQNTNGEYLQMVFDAKNMSYEEINARFQKFLWGLGCVSDTVQKRTL